ncbi:peptide-methionine (S)-S-oxide reductase [Chryseobacterium sp. Ch-15]|uniref:peptide-methionine (S)-S-oxide reductase n=1 Tax=Chryseobacterium muglaense TaxID=2893752 RepID=A0A9Q3YQU6_9FLAO|nr:peptide-methionine (S)-S-oxide reductase [Chryseobacterium muglaense]MBD3905116.1 peptide-methionine (S)-S-oxide reductase [Chryseobacterium muglaense]MCC9033443.1 peptide-methionine (S)-S-oxide reductase [Chryseobacterium muglaense]MCM2554962.1 peptide-methionine (S)-S-oxide reductase [Chryseobacterium muglaense]
MNNKIGFGGGCHWCTEAIFQSLIGIADVKQGWISSFGKNVSFSEAVLVEYNPLTISLKDLIEIHLYTHSSTSKHSFREKYRSAVYVFDEDQEKECEKIIEEFQYDFDDQIITKVLLFRDFKLNKTEQLNYLYTRRNAPFCKNIINPKLTFLMNQFGDFSNKEKIMNDMLE